MNVIVSCSRIVILSGKCEVSADDIHDCSLNDLALVLSGSQSWRLNVFLQLSNDSVNVHDSLDGLIGRYDTLVRIARSKLDYAVFPWDIKWGLIWCLTELFPSHLGLLLEYLLELFEGLFLVETEWCPLVLATIAEPAPACPQSKLASQLLFKKLQYVIAHLLIISTSLQVYLEEQ